MTTLPEEVRNLATIVRRPLGTTLPTAASDAEIDALARRTRVSIPSAVREWLAFTNGPKIGPGGVYGLNDFEKTYGFLPEFRDHRWLPLGTDGCGDYYVLALESEDHPLQPVYFIDPIPDGYEIPAYAVASIFWQFLWFLFNRELGEDRWPFDPAFVLEHDPALAKVATAPLPWVADEASRS
jgi:hypothetical protein